MQESRTQHRETANCLRRRVLLVVATSVVAANAYSMVLYDQLTNHTTTIIPSSWWYPDGYDGDTYSWDNFILRKPSYIKEVRWVGGGGPIDGVTVRFYEGLAGYPDYQPKISALPESETSRDYLKGYRFTLAQTHPTSIGGGLYSYYVTLPEWLLLPGHTVYWIKIEGDDPSGNSWGIVRASHGRDTTHFRFITGGTFQRITGDLGIQLVGDPALFSIFGVRR
ncbi:MAG: hypothetical protein U0R49_03805 [Fimbriimonadales bacterium]